jgi:hypothetical protein
VEAGGLMSYGPDRSHQNRQIGINTWRTLKREKPADPPVMRSIGLKPLINLQTATTLGIDVPPMLLALADDAIELLVACRPVWARPHPPIVRFSFHCRRLSAMQRAGASGQRASTEASRKLHGGFSRSAPR